MASVKIVTVEKGSVIRNINMDGSSTVAVDRAAIALESVIAEEKNILCLRVDYEGCNDSKTVQGYNP